MKHNTQCRICGSERLVRFLDLGNQPLANAFLKSKDEIESTYPLQVYFCEDCNLVQLLDVVDRKELFSDYIYFSSGMPKLSNHFRAYAEQVKKFLKPSDFVVEIASNDGILLRFFKDEGYKILGIDPAANVAKVAESIGVPTMVDFFSEKLASKIRRKADLILANNVIAHMEDLRDMARGIRQLLSKEGVLVIEAPYLVDMFENLTYDTIYHEHVSYLALRPLKRLFGYYGLEVFDMEVNVVQGRSLRVFVGFKGKHEVKESVKKYEDLELSMGLNRLEAYQVLAEMVAGQKKQLGDLVKGLQHVGKRIAIYGATAKGNTMLNYCGIIGLEYAVDDLSSKQGMFTPGTRVPIVNSDYAHKHEPDYYLMLAWNYEKAILEKEKDFLAKGGHFIIPVEGIRIV